MDYLKHRIIGAALLGFQYYLVVFLFAFVMGVLRMLVVAPRLGEMVAVCLEVPVVILVSWGVARWLLGKRPFTFGQRLVMGATAFILTMASEATLAAFIRGENVSTWVTSVATPLGLIGLAGQVIFAAMPILVGLNLAANVTK